MNKIRSIYNKWLASRNFGRNLTWTNHLVYFLAFISLMLPSVLALFNDSEFQFQRIISGIWMIQAWMYSSTSIKLRNQKSEMQKEIINIKSAAVRSHHINFLLVKKISKISQHVLEEAGITIRKK